MMPSSSASRTGSTRHILLRLYRLFLRRHLLRVGIAIGFMAMAALMTGALAQLMEPIIDDVFTERRAEALLPVAAAVFGAFLLRGLATYAHTVLMNQTGQGVVADIQNRTHAHLLRLDLAFFHDHPPGELSSRLINDVTVMRSAVAECLTAIFKSSLTLFVLIGVMLYQDWKLALVALTIIPAAAWAVGRIGKQLRRLSEETQSKLGDLSARLTESFGGIRQIKAFGAEKVERERIAARVDDVYQLSLKAVRTGELSTPINEVLSGLALVVLIVYGGSQVIAGTDTPGSFMAFITAFLMAYEPIKRLSKLNNVLQRGLGAAERLLHLLDTQPHIENPARPIALPPGPPAIDFNDVFFAYPDGTAALNGLSLRVEPGMTAALVGPSGAGKSTVLNLIQRFYDVSGGSVCVGGIDVREADLTALRSMTALVSQDITLFDGSVAENIALGCPDVSPQRIAEAARAAACDFIADLPDGLETPIGANGVKLSGGQRQRLAIARALLRDAPLLLLDEATSALDSVTEQAVQNALQNLLRDRTILVIAHRLSTVIDADVIHVLEHGRVVESGTHSVLSGAGGAYSRLQGTQLTAA